MSIFDGISVVLWDVDGTILNFYEAQKNAIRTCFDKFGLGICDDAMLGDYDSINHGYWKALERGEISKPQVLTGRFMDFFEKYNIGNSSYTLTELVNLFNDEYQIRLGDTICFYPGVLELIKSLKKAGIIQFAVTNGTKRAQERKLALSGLDKLFDAIYISEDVGSEKPSPQFYEPVNEEIVRRLGNIMPDEIMIIGDSLTSDMKLGNNVGIKTCWFNEGGKGNNADSELRLDTIIEGFEGLLF